MKPLLLLGAVVAIWVAAALASSGCSPCPPPDCVQICAGAPYPPYPLGYPCPLPLCACDGDGGVDAGQ